MIRKMKWWSKIDFSESNFYGAFFHLLSVAMAICSLLSSEWILIEEPAGNSTTSTDNSELFFDVSRSDHCTNIAGLHYFKGNPST
ncbi:hypothetical protein ANCCAN_11112 [Ancylostoma caninum]|uniref:Uncharacterized protein n=1 Tax=Ancylostoma caninum TaxID=29170 RepID=A0A368GI22_ANCCA|nr:hypothetical protein ANCCAN_11112 [Ancylostoma caninum]